MGRGDHNAAVEIIHPGDIGYGRRGRYMHDVGIRAGSYQTCAQGGFKHIGASSRIFADEDFGFFAKPGAVVPAQETADLHCMFKVQILVGLATETVCTEIFTHCYISSLWMISPLSL